MKLDESDSKLNVKVVKEQRAVSRAKGPGEPKFLSEVFFAVAHCRDLGTGFVVSFVAIRAVGADRDHLRRLGRSNI